LSAQSIEVEQYYPESGPGQQEISIRYSDGLSAADRQIAFRETVRAVARRHGFLASFVPKIFSQQAGSGCHLHLSLWREGVNLVPAVETPGELSLIARQFMAGILEHLPALMAITTPIPNSYGRIRPHCWSGAFRCWGYDNREAAIRVPTNPEMPSPTHFELKTVDAASNPYMALGAVIAAGLHGVREGRELPHEVQADPGLLEESVRLEKGIDPLPSSLRTSLARLEQDDVLLGAMGSELARAFLAVRRVELDTFESWGPEAEIAFLLDRY
jgi:glutamine synthetase